MAFMRNISAGYVLFCRTKENQKGRRCPEGMKAPVGLLSRRPVCGANAACSARQGHSDFDALDPTGCGPLRLLRALGGTRILQAAAPTAPPCIRHWRRSSPLQTRGCSPLIIPRQRSKRKNASRFAQTGCGPLRLLRALGGTRILQAAAPTAPPCIRRRRRSSLLHIFFASPICRPLSRCATAPRRGAGAADTAVSVTTPPVKMRLERPCGCAAMKAPVGLSSRRAVCDSRWKDFVLTSVGGATNANIKIIFPLIMARAHAVAISNSVTPAQTTRHILWRLHLPLQNPPPRGSRSPVRRGSSWPGPSAHRPAPAARRRHAR